MVCSTDIVSALADTLKAKKSADEEQGHWAHQSHKQHTEGAFVHSRLLLALDIDDKGTSLMKTESVASDNIFRDVILSSRTAILFTGY